MVATDLRPKARLKSSLKWTPFPAEFLDQIKKVFDENFSALAQTHSPGSEFLAEGWIYANELTLRLGLVQKGRLTQANFEVSADYNAKEEKFIEHIYRCVDLAGSMMEEYLTTDGEMELPRIWKKTDFDGGTLWFQFSTVNSSLEAQANALLGVDPRLVSPTEEVEDVVGHPAHEDASPDEGEDPDEIEEPAPLKKKGKLH